MNDRELDLLIQHVFGDAEGDEAAEAAKLAGQSPKEAALWAELKSDLRSLNEVPECQMSVERLQHAILNKTQKEAAKGWSLAKVFGGLSAVAAGAFAIVMTMNLMPKAGPEAIVASGEDTRVAINTETGANRGSAPDVRRALTPPTGNEVKPAPVEERSDARPSQVIRESSGRRQFPSNRDSDNDLLAVPDANTGTTLTSAPPSGLGGPGGGGGGRGAGSYADGSAEAISAKVLPAENPEDSVVIVESSFNQDGTREAREVSRNSEDVIFGG